jgi:hypothetical protein
MHAAESCVRQQEREFEQCESVRSEDEKRIPQEFIRASAEMIQRPAFTENL